ncbi:hypothetical protein Q9Q99_01750 [Curtobacterium flaccumfaciens]|nr:hypothetical protein Q9Q99_01750 [Curtobacterium flaccumfaciens]
MSTLVVVMVPSAATEGIATVSARLPPARAAAYSITASATSSLVRIVERSYWICFMWRPPGAQQTVPSLVAVQEPGASLVARTPRSREDRHVPETMHRLLREIQTVEPSVAAEALARTHTTHDLSVERTDAEFVFEERIRGTSLLSLGVHPLHGATCAERSSRAAR